MTPRAVSTLFELLHRGVALTVVDGRLRVWPASALDDGLRAAVARDKPQLVAWLGWLPAPADRAGLWARCASALLARRRDYPRGRCQACGYNLRGNTSGVCPECGQAV